jgi:hypothetical protein
LRVRELSTRCPLILLLGLNPSQETKALSLRHFAMLVPISLSSVKIALQELVVEVAKRQRVAD